MQKLLAALLLTATLPALGAVVIPGSWEWGVLADTCSLSEAAEAAKQINDQIHTLPIIVPTRDSIPHYVVLYRSWIEGSFGPPAGYSVKAYDSLTDATMAHNAEYDTNKGVVTAANGEALYWHLTRVPPPCN